MNTEASDTQDLALVCHLVGEQLDVSVVDLDSVLAYCELDLIDDLRSCSFNSQHSGGLHDMIGRGLAEIDTWRTHDLSQTVTFDRQVVFFLSGILGNDSSLNSRATLNDDMGQFAL